MVPKHGSVCLLFLGSIPRIAPSTQNPKFTTGKNGRISARFAARCITLLSVERMKKYERILFMVQLILIKHFPRKTTYKN